MNDEKMRELLLEKMAELAFGPNGDIAKLAFLSRECKEPFDLEKLNGLDLSRLTEIHKLANGSIELKTLDRLKLIELLLGATAGADAAQPDATGLIAAIDRAAQRLGGAADGTDGGGAKNEVP